MPLLNITGGLFSQNAAGYKPLINYKLSTRISDNLRYLSDSGTSPKYHASMYFGRGMKQNGTDQTITIPINDTVNTIAYFKNGTLVFDETLQTLTDYVTDVTSADIYQNFIFYKGIFEDYEKASLETNPEKFLYNEKQADGTFVAKSEILSQDKIDNVVAHLPMTETDGYVRNMIGYSEGSNIVTSNSFVEWGTVGAGTVTDNGDGSFTVEVTTETDSQSYPRLDMNQLYDRLSGEVYKYNITVESLDGNSPVTISIYDGALLLIGNGVGDFTKVSLCSVDRTSGHFYLDGRTLWKVKITMSEKKLTNTYPIANYTDAVRDNAKNLQSGLQTCFWKRDVLGIQTSLSDYLEFDDVGHVDTSWIPSGVFQVEEVVVLNGVSTHFVYDNNGDKFTNGISDGTYTIPTIATVLKETTFDNIDGVSTRKMFTVHTEIQVISELYNKALLGGLV